ncbi:MAG TPA: hypothetical protein VGP84_13660 [Gemmatimonadaceae bacterium]|jgi:uncharacterized membrane protein|nr:hypothetical protein [Gemmatimonadaceae bacterium]
MRILSWSHAVFAATMIALGVFALTKGNFPSTWTGVPRGMPLREAFIYLTALISLGCGVGLFWRRTAVVAARVLLAAFLMWLFLFRAPQIFSAPAAIGTWWGLGDTAVMIAAVWVLYAWLTADGNARRLNFGGGDKGLLIARVFYGLALIPFGVAHFTNLNDTVVLIPHWLPWHVSWAYFTGGAFIAAGIAVLTGVFARLGTTLSVWELGLITLIVWVPIVSTGAATPFQLTEFVTSCVLTAGAWVVADSYRGTPWLAAGKLRLPLTTLNRRDSLTMR